MPRLRKVFDNICSPDFLLALPERAIVACWFAHMVIYALLAYIQPGFLSFFTPLGKFSFKFLDPQIWPFWLLGFYVILHVGFFEILGWPSFFASVGLASHTGSIVLGIFNGFFVGFIAMG